MDLISWLLCTVVKAGYNSLQYSKIAIHNSGLAGSFKLIIDEACPIKCTTHSAKIDLHNNCLDHHLEVIRTCTVYYNLCSQGNKYTLLHFTLGGAYEGGRVERHSHGCGYTGGNH